MHHGSNDFDLVSPLKRAIQQWIENPLAQKILSGDYAPGDEVGVDVEAGEFVFR